MSEGFLFGKMPAHGDFIARGLAADERIELDDWLSAEMISARDALGEAFEERFHAAPPWCFVWAGDEGWTAGALAPSVDSIGRRFPLMFGLRGVGQSAIVQTAENCVEAIYSAVGDSWTADRLVEVDVARTGGRSDVVGDLWWTQGGLGFAPAERVGQRPRGLIKTVLTRAGA